MQNESRILGLSPLAFLVAAAAVVKFALHVLTGSGYGFFCDEHMNNYLWGPGYTWEVMILLTAVPDVFRPLFAEMELKAVIKNEYAMPFNANMVFVCRQTSLEDIWSRLKNY